MAEIALFLQIIIQPHRYVPMFWIQSKGGNVGNISRLTNLAKGMSL